MFRILHFPLQAMLLHGEDDPDRLAQITKTHSVSLATAKAIDACACVWIVKDGQVAAEIDVEPGCDFTLDSLPELLRLAADQELDWTNEEAVDGFVEEAESFAADITYRWNQDIRVGSEHPDNQVYRLIEQTNGVHQFGGTPPESFVMPTPDVDTTSVYLGCIRSHGAFDWLPVPELHMVAPVFATFHKVLVDHSDPLRPQILEIEGFDPQDGAPTKHEQLVYQAHHFDAVPVVEGPTEESLGWAGVPQWIQSPMFPQCPRTDEPMRFVATFFSDQTKLVSTAGLTKDVIKHNKVLHFWGDGFLYVFMHPQSKIAAYVIQNS